MFISCIAPQAIEPLKDMILRMFNVGGRKGHCPLATNIFKVEFHCGTAYLRNTSVQLLEYSATASEKIVEDQPGPYNLICALKWQSISRFYNLGSMEPIHVMCPTNNSILIVVIIERDDQKIPNQKSRWTVCQERYLQDYDNISD